MCWIRNTHVIIIHSETIGNTFISDTLGCQHAMLTAMIVKNHCVLELQQRRKEETRTCDTIVTLKQEQKINQERKIDRKKENS